MFAHQYCVDYNKSNANTGLSAFWSWHDPKPKFDEFDNSITKLLGEMTLGKGKYAR